MRIFGASVDSAPLVLSDRVFREPVYIAPQPTYGRVIFKRHDATISGITIDVEHPETALELGPGLNHSMVMYCNFISNAIAIHL